MGFDEVRFPVDIAYGSTGGPQYATDIVTTAGGHEQRNANWANARARYNVAHGVKNKAQLDALIAFFRARQGKARGFRFKDWMDFSASNQLIGVGDAEKTVFQITKHYISGAVEEQRMIHKPVSGTVKIYKNGVLQTSGVTIDHTRGLVTFSSPPANAVLVVADYEFDVPVRFDTDHLSARMENYGVFGWNDIPLVEIRIL